MGHEWKVGDWAEINGARCLVYCVGDLFIDGILQESSLTTWHKLGDEAKYLPECTGWDWEPLKPVEPTARKWEFGDWAHSPEGIVRFFFEKDGGGLCVSKDGRSHCFQFQYLEYLPDCTGFGWNDPVWNPVKPIAPPTGYRLLGRNETVAEGDLCIEVPGMSSHPSWRAAGGKSIGCTAGFRIDSYGIAAFARKVEIVNPIEPPPGYRIIADGVVSDGDMSLQDRGWYYSTAKGKDIAELLDLGAAKAYARKIEQPKAVPPAGYRLLGREEVVADGDLFIKRAPAGNDYDWRTASVDHFGTTVGYLVDIYHIACFARKIEQRSKPIEPPDGYRLVASGEVVVAGDMYFDGCWQDVPKYASAMGKPWDAETQYPICRKIEPKPIDPPKGYRLMKDEETIRHGDMFWQGGAWNQTGERIDLLAEPRISSEPAVQFAKPSLISIVYQCLSFIVMCGFVGWCLASLLWW